MYLPEQYAEKDPEKLFSIMREFSFAALISQENGAPYASHLPLLAERSESGAGVLWGHMARANLQWKTAEGQRVMAIFSGPHAYISPTWYDAPNTVPTWNYVTVHAYGVFRAIQDPDETMKILERTVSAYESPRAVPWKFDGSTEFYKHMAKGVVAFHIELDSVEGKMKLSQNQPPERQEKVIQALQASSDQNDSAVAAWMRARLNSRPDSDKNHSS